MTPRERVIASLDHMEADKVSINFGSTPSLEINIVAHSKLREHLGLNTGLLKAYKLFQQLAFPEDDALNRIHSDNILIHSYKPRLDIPAYSIVHDPYKYIETMKGIRIKILLL